LKQHIKETEKAEKNKKNKIKNKERLIFPVFFKNFFSFLLGFQCSSLSLFFLLG